MSSPLKQLKKLKKVKKSYKPLQIVQSTAKVPCRSTSGELLDIAKSAGKVALIEAAGPLKPILSWLNEDSYINVVDVSHCHTNSKQQVASPKQSHTAQHIARLPLKSPPCKRCPALRGGLCKCALKRA